MLRDQPVIAVQAAEHFPREALIALSENLSEGNELLPTPDIAALAMVGGYLARAIDENGLSREPAALEGPPSPGRTEQRCTWVHLVPRPCCTIEGVSGHLPTRRAHEQEQTSSGSGKSLQAFSFLPLPGPVVNACWRHPRAPVLVTTPPPSSSEPTGPDIKPRGRGHLPTRRSSPASGRRRPPGAVRVYKPFLACRSRSGHQCPLVTPMDPSHRDHFAAAGVVARVFLPGRPSTMSCHLEESLPGHAYPPSNTCRVHRATRPGFR
ncbi:hypothetical protein MRX96_045332 [Rhipicephalus microplus]